MSAIKNVTGVVAGILLTLLLVACAKPPVPITKKIGGGSALEMDAPVLPDAAGTGIAGDSMSPGSSGFGSDPNGASGSGSGSLANASGVAIHRGPDYAGYDPKDPNDPLNNPKSLLSEEKRIIYYPTDGDTVPEKYWPVVLAHAEYLVAHPDRKVRLDGHTDERGSAEYNLALGQRRADNVKKMLLGEGVKEEQIEPISYGEEKPADSAHAETAWSKNRRTELNYKPY